MARGWMDNCLRNHTTCSKSFLTGWKPSRLLDVTEDKIKLVFQDSAEPHLPYVTLSHCWGTEKFLVLTPDLVPRFIEGVDISEFPLTFQETMITVRRLNVRYLWIDCYCIMQGSDTEALEDWRRDSLSMGDVYANSLLNIGALDSEGPANGLFRHRPSDPIYSKIEWSPSGQDKPQIFYLIRLDHRRDTVAESFHRSENSALMKRGWVVQECVMAPRMLSFGRQLLWQCDCLSAFEQIPCSESDSQGPNNRAAGGFSFWLLSDGANSQYMYGGFGSRWMVTLSIYTDTCLSYPQKDLFAALDGVGTELAKRSGSIFKNGILASVLHESLLFSSNGNVRNLLKDMPTWHWSSCYPGVNFGFAEYIAHRRRSYLPMAYSFMSDDCRQLPDGSSRNYWPNLIFVGRLLTRQLRNQTNFFDRREEGGSSSDEGKVYVPLFRSQCTFVSQERLRSSYYDSSSRTHCYGLILAQSKSGAYHRLGIWKVYLGSKLYTRIIKTRPQLIVLE